MIPNQGEIAKNPNSDKQNKISENELKSVQ